MYLSHAEKRLSGQPQAPIVEAWRWRVLIRRLFDDYGVTAARLDEQGASLTGDHN